MGPFRGKLGQWLVRRTLNKARHIFVREDYSREQVTGAGVDADRVSLIPDLAFHLLKQDNTADAATAGEGNLGDSKHNVAVVIGTESSDTDSHYIKSMAALCDYIIDTKDAQILMVPLSADVLPDDDIISLKNLQRLMKRRDKAQVLPYNPSLYDINAVFQRVDLVISSRFHGIVLSRPTPVIAIPTTFLGYRLVGIMGILGLSEYVCYLDKASSLDHVKKVFDKAWAQRKMIRVQQKKVMENILSQLDSAAEELKRLVGIKSG